MRCARVATAITAGIFASSICLLAVSLTPLHANDSSASMAAGGLELVKNDHVRMVSEILRIAPRLVEVDYIFENTSNTDVTTEVAFPLPEISQTAWYYSPLNIPFGKDSNVVGFRVWIDGRELKPDREIRAFVKDHEITADLQRLGIDPFSPDLGRPDVVDALRRLGLIIDDGVIDGKSNKGTPVADWSIRISFHWSQTFQAGKRVAVRHSYRPIYGNYYVKNTDSRTRVTKNSQKLGGQWCFDQSFNAAELRLLDRQYEAAAKEKYPQLSDLQVNYENVQYVLKTGANWQGPIGHFEMQIKKEGADLISTCPIPGLELRRAPYGFNAVASNYTPTSNLDILFVSGRWLCRPDGGGGPRQ